jgi:curved DNA-binding protein CbpA
MMGNERSPYEVLGLERSATPEQIKKAFRKRSSEAHPDRPGGDAREMQCVNDAYALLSDPARRKLYDETGEQGAAANLEDIARGMIGNELGKIVDGEAWLDPVAQLKAAIEKQAQDATTAYGVHVDRLKVLRDRSRSFVVKPGADDFVRPIFSARIETCEQAIKACEKLKAAAELARELIAPYRFDDFLRAEAARQRTPKTISFGEHWLK